MMVRDKLFVYSALFSFFVYFLLVASFFLYVKGYDVKKYDALKKQTILELELIIDKKEQNIQKTKTPKAFEIKSKDVTKTSSRKITKTANIKSLFAKVKTSKDKPIAKKEVLNVTKSLLSSRYKSKFEKEKKADSLDVSKILDNVVHKSKKLSVQTTTNNNSYDRYYSKIYEILNNRWNPKYKISGLESIVLVIIDNSGSFSYNILKLSKNPIFDRNLKNFLDGQTSENYPSHDKKNMVKLQVTFKSEE